MTNMDVFEQLAAEMVARKTTVNDDGSAINTFPAINGVVDGDTVKRESDTVRLRGINTPEIGKTIYNPDGSIAKHQETEPGALPARDATVALSEGATFDGKPETDAYGRSVQTMRDAQGTDVAQTLAEAGLGRSHGGFPTQPTENAAVTHMARGLNAAGDKFRDPRVEPMRVQALQEKQAQPFDPKGILSAQKDYTHNQGEVSKAVDRGLDMVSAMSGGFAEAVGEATGLDSVAEYGRRVREYNDAEMAMRQARVSSVFDIENAGDAGSWAVTKIIENAPNAAVSAASGLLAAGVGSLALGPGAPLGWLGGGAAALASYVLNTGEIQGNLKRTAPDEAHGGAALIGGVPAAALDVAPMLGAARVITSSLRREAGQELAGLSALGVAKAVGKGAGKGMLAEAPTEAAQEINSDLVQKAVFGDEYDVITEENIRKWIDAGAAGGISGAGMGGGASSIGVAAAKYKYGGPQAVPTEPTQTVTSPATVPEKTEDLLAQIAEVQRTDTPSDTVLIPLAHPDVQQVQAAAGQAGLQEVLLEGPGIEDTVMVTKNPAFVAEAKAKQGQVTQEDLQHWGFGKDPSTATGKSGVTDDSQTVTARNAQGQELSAEVATGEEQVADATQRAQQNFPDAEVKNEGPAQVIQQRTAPTQVVGAEPVIIQPGAAPTATPMSGLTQLDLTRPERAEQPVGEMPDSKEADLHTGYRVLRETPGVTDFSQKRNKDGKLMSRGAEIQQALIEEHGSLEAALSHVADKNTFKFGNVADAMADDPENADTIKLLNDHVDPLRPAAKPLKVNGEEYNTVTQALLAAHLPGDMDIEFALEGEQTSLKTELAGMNGITTVKALRNALAHVFAQPTTRNPSQTVGQALDDLHRGVDWTIQTAANLYQQHIEQDELGGVLAANLHGNRLLYESGAQFGDDTPTVMKRLIGKDGQNTSNVIGRALSIALKAKVAGQTAPTEVSNEKFSNTNLREAFARPAPEILATVTRLVDVAAKAAGVDAPRITHEAEQLSDPEREAVVTGHLLGKYFPDTKTLFLSSKVMEELGIDAHRGDKARTAWSLASIDTLFHEMGHHVIEETMAELVETQAGREALAALEAVHQATAPEQSLAEFQADSVKAWFVNKFQGNPKALADLGVKKPGLSVQMLNAVRGLLTRIGTRLTRLWNTLVGGRDMAAAVDRLLEAYKASRSTPTVEAPAADVAPPPMLAAETARALSSNPVLRPATLGAEVADTESIPAAAPSTAQALRDWMQTMTSRYVRSAAVAEIKKPESTEETPAPEPPTGWSTVRKVWALLRTGLADMENRIKVKAASHGSAFGAVVPKEATDAVVPKEATDADISRQITTLAQTARLSRFERNYLTSIDFHNDLAQLKGMLGDNPTPMLDDALGKLNTNLFAELAASDQYIASQRKQVREALVNQRFALRALRDFEKRGVTKGKAVKAAKQDANHTTTILDEARDTLDELNRHREALQSKAITAAFRALHEFRTGDMADINGRDNLLASANDAPMGLTDENMDDMEASELWLNDGSETADSESPVHHITDLDDGFFTHDQVLHFAELDARMDALATQESLSDEDKQALSQLWGDVELVQPEFEAAIQAGDVKTLAQRWNDYITSRFNSVSKVIWHQNTRDGNRAGIFGTLPENVERTPGWPTEEAATRAKLKLMEEYPGTLFKVVQRRHDGHWILAELATTDLVSTIIRRAQIAGKTSAPEHSVTVSVWNRRLGKYFDVTLSAKVLARAVGSENKGGMETPADYREGFNIALDALLSAREGTQRRYLLPESFTNPESKTFESNDGKPLIVGEHEGIPLALGHREGAINLYDSHQEAHAALEAMNRIQRIQEAMDERVAELKQAIKAHVATPADRLIAALELEVTKIRRLPSEQQTIAIEQARDRLLALETPELGYAQILNPKTLSRVKGTAPISSGSLRDFIRDMVNTKPLSEPQRRAYAQALDQLQATTDQITALLSQNREDEARKLMASYEDRLQEIEDLEREFGTTSLLRDADLSSSIDLGQGSAWDLRNRFLLTDEHWYSHPLMDKGKNLGHPLDALVAEGLLVKLPGWKYMATPKLVTLFNRLLDANPDLSGKGPLQLGQRENLPLKSSQVRDILAALKREHEAVARQKGFETADGRDDFNHVEEQGQQEIAHEAERRDMADARVQMEFNNREDRPHAATKPKFSPRTTPLGQVSAWSLSHTLAKAHTALDSILKTLKLGYQVHLVDEEGVSNMTQWLSDQERTLLGQPRDNAQEIAALRTMRERLNQAMTNPETKDRGAWVIYLDDLPVARLRNPIIFLSHVKASGLPESQFNAQVIGRLLGHEVGHMIERFVLRQFPDLRQQIITELGLAGAEKGLVAEVIANQFSKYLQAKSAIGSRWNRFFQAVGAKLKALWEFLTDNYQLSDTYSQFIDSLVLNRSPGELARIKQESRHGAVPARTEDLPDMEGFHDLNQDLDSAVKNTFSWVTSRTKALHEAALDNRHIGYRLSQLEQTLKPFATTTQQIWTGLLTTMAKRLDGLATKTGSETATLLRNAMGRVYGESRTPGSQTLLERIRAEMGVFHADFTKLYERASKDTPASWQDRMWWANPIKGPRKAYGVFTEDSRVPVAEFETHKEASAHRATLFRADRSKTYRISTIHHADYRKQASVLLRQKSIAEVEAMNTSGEYDLALEVMKLMAKVHDLAVGPLGMTLKGFRERLPLVWDTGKVLQHRKALSGLFQTHVGLTAQEAHDFITDILDSDGVLLSLEGMVNIRPQRIQQAANILDAFTRIEAFQNEAEGFLVDDIVALAYNYTQSVIKRGVSDQMFGTKLPSGNFDSMGKIHLALFRDAEKLTPEEAEWLKTDVYNMIMGRFGKKGFGPAARKVTSWAMMYESIRLLGGATLSSFVDVGTIAHRAGWDTFSKGTRELASTTNRKELELALRSLGVVAEEVTDHIMSDAMNSQYMMLDAQQAMSFFFRFNGLSQWTKMTRLWAGGMTIQYFKDLHARLQDPASRVRAERELKEMQLTEAMLSAWAGQADQSIVGLLNSAQRRGLHENMGVAINKLVDEMVLRPNSGDKPGWAFNPYLALVWHLKTFMFLFHSRVLSRVWHEMSADDRHGLNRAVPPLLLAAFLLPLAAGGYWLRKLLTGDLQALDKMTAERFSEEMFQRSGLLGIYQFFADMKNAAEMKKSVGLAIAGPTLGHIGDFFNKPTDQFILQAIPGVSNSPGLRRKITELVE